VSTTLVERERLTENLENKVKKPKYDPYAEEFDPVSGTKKILSKYDDDLEEKKRRVMAPVFHSNRVVLRTWSRGRNFDIRSIE
jgi:SART-1 family